MKIKPIIFLCFFGSITFNGVFAQTETIPQKVDALLKKMTLAEKIGMLHGNALFSSDGVKRLGIPELTCDDGPLGVREEIKRFDWNSAGWTTDSATCGVWRSRRTVSICCRSW